MADIAIHVEAKHIEQGKAQDAAACPIARALQERFARVLSHSPNPVVVGFDEVLICTDVVNTLVNPRLPKEAQAFVKSFDIRDTVLPFTFTLEVPLWFSARLEGKEVKDVTV